MRNLYQDHNTNPVVHPRYKAAYQQVYSRGGSEHKGTFGIRCMVCVLIFITYMMIEINRKDVFGMDDLQVKQKIMQNYITELY